MALSNFVPTIWSTQVLLALRKQLVFAMLTNRDYEGEVMAAGDTVKIQTPGAIAVNDYAGSISYETPTSSTQSLLIDQKKYAAFQVPDVNALQANVNLRASYADMMAYALADALDANIAALYTGAGNSTSLDISSNNDGVRAALVDAGKKLSEDNVPSAGRWLVVSPTVEAGIRGAYGDRESGLGDGVAANGFIGRLEGFNIYMSNNVQVDTQHKCLYGTNAAITLAIQKEPTIEALRLEDSFADGIRALMVWGRKVVQANALGVLNTTVA